MNEHRSDVRNGKDSCRCDHFANNGHSECSPSDVMVQPIEQIPDFKEISNLTNRSKKRREFRLQREEWWMKELWTVTPYGLNDKCEGKRWTERKEDEQISNFNQNVHALALDA